MKKILILILMTPFLSYSAEFMFNGGLSYNQTNITAQKNVPTYRGSGYFGELEYLVPFTNKNALSFFGTYHRSSQKDVANDDISEHLQIGYMGAGLKLYFGAVSLSASLGKVSFQDKVSGTINKKINSDEIGKEFGLGYRYKLSKLTGVIISGHALHSGLNPSNGSGFYDNYELWQYRVSVGFSFIIPSNPNR